MYAIKEINEQQVICWNYKQTKIYIIHPDFMVDNEEISLFRISKVTQTRFMT